MCKQTYVPTTSVKHAQNKDKKDKVVVCLFLQKLRKEEAGQSGGEEEPEEESHTPLPPPMQIIKDPNNPEVNREEQGVNKDI